MKKHVIFIISFLVFLSMVACAYPDSRPTNPAISLDRAIEIAYQDLENRSINATYHSHSGIHRHRSQWVWELLFRTQGERMSLIEYYINVDNGNIVKFEWDD